MSQLSTMTGANLSAGGQLRITRPTTWDTSFISQPQAAPIPSVPALPAQNTNTQAPPPPSPSTTGVTDNLSGLTYDAETYRDLPARKFLEGEIGRPEYSQLGNQRSPIPALGVDLQAPNAQNWSKLNYLYKSSPAAFALMSSLYKAANRDLLSEMATLSEYAPTGQAFAPSLISTR